MKKDASNKDYNGQDSLLISETEIIRRNSLIASSLLWNTLVKDVDGELERVNETVETDESPYLSTFFKENSSGTKYKIIKRLTAGGMGEVYYIFDEDFGRHSAMKVILPEHKCKPKMVDSFLSEARITGQLEHPNIIPVHDMGCLPDHGVFFTMKLMRGESLHSLLQKLEIGSITKDESSKKYDLFELLGIFRKICDAVAFAHSKNIIHRDIKPHNIMVGDYGEVLLMDWGLAKQLDSNTTDSDKVGSPPPPKLGSSSTEFGVVKGSPAYMSPEQAYGDIEGLDLQSDIFLLGSTLYNILTFYPPYLGDDVFQILECARNRNLKPPNEMATSNFPIPEDLSRIVMKALAEKKEDRYKTVKEFSDDLDAFLRGDMQFCHRVFKKGEILIQEGEVGAESYIIIEGKVEVFKKKNDENVIISTLSKGDIVGEMSLITLEKRSASVVALEKTEVLVITQELFTQHLTKLPPWLAHTIVLLAERLNTANEFSSSKPD